MDGRLVNRVAVGLVALVAVLALSVAPASAEYGITAIDGEANDITGAPMTQAGGHADVSLKLGFRTKPNPFAVEPYTMSDGSTRSIEVELPPGLVGNPRAVPTCPEERLLSHPIIGTYYSSCPNDTVVGLAEVRTNSSNDPVLVVPVANLDPPPGVAAQFGFNINGGITKIQAFTREGGRKLVTRTIVSQGATLIGTMLTLWGVPGDPRHDPVRGGPAGICGDGTFGACPAHLAPTPFMSNPTDCSAGPLPTNVRADSWQNPGVFASGSFLSHLPDGTLTGVTGCDLLPFDPTLRAVPTAHSAGAPTGLVTDLELPQDENPNGVSTAHLKKAVVTLPEGMALNPGAADGLVACTDDQLHMVSDEPMRCPEASKIGTATAQTPLLAEPITGAIYQRPQASNDPESGDMFRVALVLENLERGVSIRVPGQIRADKDTGRLVTTFDDNPQMPLAKLRLEFKGGPRAPLAMPTSCGQKTIEAELTSRSGKTVSSPSTFDVPCTPGLGGFTPSLTAGSANAVAGASAPFNLTLSRPDGNADVTGLSMTMPTGLLARLKGNVGTQLGTAKAFSGSGSNPYMLPGKVFLEGQYGDAPFSLKVVVPAKAGPFDLGEVVVRQKVYVDPIDAHVTIVSDPLPTIVSGVPVRLQRLDVSVDKPGFMVNPTSCAAKTIGGTLNAAGGQTAPINVRFQVGDCGSLALKPELALSLSGKGQTTDGKHPAVSATLTQPAGQANLKRVKVTLPLSLALDPDNSNSDALCSFVEGSKPDPKCPASSVVGQATAVSPILNEPLTGPVYFVKNERKDPKSGRSIKTTPKLVIPLTGENGVKLTLTGASDVEDDQLVTTFDNIPDAQVSSFKMDIAGGPKGILVVSGEKADICKANQIADQRIDGQNNMIADADVYIQTPACKTKIISKKIGKKSVALKIGGLGAGKVTVTGRGIKKTTKTITRSTVATVTAKRTKGKPGGFKVKFISKAAAAKASKASK